ncbi:MAG: lysine--tRNA ligase [Phycisphaerales bacterium]|nr:lysine--tRNA ligase [Phycisphaerales bacterium]
MTTDPSPAGGAAGSADSVVDVHKLEAQRRANRAAIAELGVAPYGVRIDGIEEIAAARGKYDPAADAEQQARGKEPGFVDGRPVGMIAGRIMLLRDNGKLIWMNLRDATGDMQVAISQKDCEERGFKLAKLCDLGDVVVASGRVMKTKSGEITLWCSSLKPGCKSLAMPPEKHAGLQDVEIRYRQRYMDLWANPETVGVFQLRSKIVSRVRRFLEERAYLEVETPMLQTLAGGAAARPFVTKMNALDINLFMRIAPELYLKRLLVGGFPRVFEVNRNFRNEGLDKQHNPEFTMLEAYHAFGDVETVMELTESLIRDLARCVKAGDFSRAPDGRVSGEGVVLPFGELAIDYGAPFVRISYGGLFEKAYGFPMSDVRRAREELKRRHPRLVRENPAAIDQMDDVMVINELFEDKQHGGEARLDVTRPTFITDYPAAISPLTRPKRDNQPGQIALADRADLFIAGMEVAPHYTELNDPDVQEAKFREQLKGADAEKSAEESTFRTFDADFIRALKVGMPPAGGMGLGVDRLVMVLANQRTIRDILLFPLMRPEE